MKKKICLWSCPRNVSTALMYSFANRNDTKVFDEPLYAHYLKISKKQHPGRKEVLECQENNGETVVKEILLKDHAPISFHKLMTHFLKGINYDFLSQVTNILLIRNPIEIIHSYNQIISNPSMEDIGMKMQYDLFHILNRKKQITTLIDAKELLENTENILRKLCLRINIPFQKNMLTWEKGPKREDGVWAKYWYKNVHKSTNFSNYIPKKITLKGSNLKLANESEKYYQFLYDKSLKNI